MHNIGIVNDLTGELNIDQSIDLQTIVIHAGVVFGSGTKTMTPSQLFRKFCQTMVVVR